MMMREGPGSLAGVQDEGSNTHSTKFESNRPRTKETKNEGAAGEANQGAANEEGKDIKAWKQGSL